VKTIEYSGFDPSSATLASSICIGWCFGDEFPHARTQEWHDGAVAPASGDYVLILHDSLHGPVKIMKRLQRTRDGRWWAECLDNTLPLDVFENYRIVKVVRTLVSDEPLVVAEDPRAGDPMSPEMAKAWADLAAPAINEWKRFGYPPRETMPEQLRCKA